jgi:nucleotide-binding universal stress UspA family protein
MKILIAVDGSEFSREAVEKTCQLLVMPENTEIKIVCVYQPVVPIDAFPQSAEYSERLEEKEIADADSFVVSAAAFVKERFPKPSVKVETQIEAGTPDQTVLEIARDWKPNVIVVGSHGRGFWGRLTLGSISDSIIHHAPCSVLVVRKTESE